MRSPVTYILALSTGFIFLSFEILWIRLFSIAARSHPVAFGIVLGVYLMGLGTGAAFIRRYTDRDNKAVQLLLHRLLIISGLACFLVIPLTSLISSFWFYAYRYGLAFLFLAAFSFGGILPLLVRHIVDNESDAGKGVGYVYGANIFGSILGSLATGYLFLDYFSISTISLFLTCFCLLLPFLLLLVNSKLYPLKGFLTPLFLIGIVLFFGKDFHFKLYENLMYMGRSRYVPSFTKVIENRSGVITVTDKKIVYGNGAYDGVIGTSPVSKVRSEIENAYLAFLFKPEAKNILEIGLSTGSWAQVLVHGPIVKSLVSVEINPGYLELIEKYDEVKSLLKNSKFTPVIDDGRRWLRVQKEKKFDLIVMNTTFHWRNHATDLLSVEFMRQVKSHLLPGGVIYIGTTFSRDAMKTVAAVFPYVTRHSVYLIASDSPLSINRKKFARILRNYHIDGQKIFNLERAEDRKIYEKLVSLSFNDSWDRILKETGKSKIITDDNMATEFTFIRKLIKRKE